MDPVVRVLGVSKAFDSRTALAGVSLDLHPGARLACHELDRRWIESAEAMVAENYRWHEAHGFDPHDVPAVSALAQGIGYLAAAAGPVALGILHEATDGWLWPDVLLAGTVLVLVALGGAIGSRLHRAHAFERIAK